MEIKNGIYSIDLFTNRAYLIAEERLTLIDTGMPFQAGRIERFITSIGRNPHDLDLIILTHHHIDHRGSARALKRSTGAKIAAHTDDIPYIEGTHRSFTGPYPWWVRSLLFLTELLFQRERITVDIPLKNKEMIDNLTVIHTPGHTEGSISLLHKKKRILFCGDTVPYTLGKLKKPNPYTKNHEEEFTSIRELTKYDFDVVLPNDCRMVLKHGRKKLIDFCEGKKEGR
jgi:hydroxyacylglutathione hydrolase